MLDIYDNIFQSERSVEIAFYEEKLKYLSENNPNLKVLDIGGIPSNRSHFSKIYNLINERKIIYKIADFRGGDYIGDFVSLKIEEAFDVCVFLSSLEHFPQCTEGDKLYRDNEDAKGYAKALSLLNDNGIILLTVPFGFHTWQEYHQNYNYEGIIKLTKGSSIIEQHVFVLKDNKWYIEKNLETTKNIRYTDQCYCVGCFMLRKDSH